MTQRKLQDHLHPPMTQRKLQGKSNISYFPLRDIFTVSPGRDMCNAV